MHNDITIQLVRRESDTIEIQDTQGSPYALTHIDLFWSSFQDQDEGIYGTLQKLKPGNAITVGLYLIKPEEEANHASKD